MTNDEFEKKSIENFKEAFPEKLEKSGEAINKNLSAITSLKFMKSDFGKHWRLLSGKLAYFSECFNRIEE